MKCFVNTKKIKYEIHEWEVVLAVNSKTMNLCRCVKLILACMHLVSY